MPLFEAARPVQVGECGMPGASLECSWIFRMALLPISSRIVAWLHMRWVKLSSGENHTMKTQLAPAVIALFAPFMMAAQSNGCSGSQPIGSNDNNSPGATANSTGDCAVSGSGDIDCYSVAGPDARWIPDCNHPRQRYYWRTFAEPVGDGTRNSPTASMMPRPDGMGLVFGICDGEDPVLASLFDQNHLCKEILGSAEVDALNAMPLADALTISHALHQRLVFSPYAHPQGGWDITPFALPEDLRDACPATGNPSIIDRCNSYLDVVCGNTSIGVHLGLSEAEANELASALNQLYGAVN